MPTAYFELMFVEDVTFRSQVSFCLFIFSFLSLDAVTLILFLKMTKKPSLNGFCPLRKIQLGVLGWVRAVSRLSVASSTLSWPP